MVPRMSFCVVIIMFGTKKNIFIQREWLLLLRKALKGSPNFFLSTPSSKQRSVEINVASEVFITRCGGGKKTLITERYTSNTTFTVPDNVIGNSFYVTVYGAGGGGSCWGGGEGGYMNNGYCELVPGSSISIIIGAGGSKASSTSTAGGSGEVTIFGYYISTNGATSGGNAPSYRAGGYGGSGGSANIIHIAICSTYSTFDQNSCKSFQFGGGCGGYMCNGGDGDPFGGGGGCRFGTIGSGYGGRSGIDAYNEEDTIFWYGGGGGLRNGGGAASISISVFSSD